MTDPFAMVEATDGRTRTLPSPGLMRFSAIKREHGLSWPPDSEEISLSVGLFRDLLRFAVVRVRFDERFYLHTYPDVADALANGLFTDAHHHYVEFGYFEDRLPFRVDVDATFYFRAYPDIKTAVADGAVPSAQAHFERYGFQEGRLPREDWSLLTG
jgi:hypothetical protein